MADVGQRHGDADERDDRMFYRNRRVQHVHLHAGARASRPAEAARPRFHDLGTLGVVLHRRQIRQLLERIADDPSILGDEGDTR